MARKQEYDVDIAGFDRLMQEAGYQSRYMLAKACQAIYPQFSGTHIHNFRRGYVVEDKAIYIMAIALGADPGTVLSFRTPKLEGSLDLPQRAIVIANEAEVLRHKRQKAFDRVVGLYNSMYNPKLFLDSSVVW